MSEASRASRRARSAPLLIVCYVLGSIWVAQGETHPVILEVVSIEDLADDFQSASELLLDLIFGAEHVRVVLGKRPHTGKARKLPALLVAVECCELGVAQGKIPV